MPVQPTTDNYSLLAYVCASLAEAEQVVSVIDAEHGFAPGTPTVTYALIIEHPGENDDRHAVPANLGGVDTEQIRVDLGLFPPGVGTPEMLDATWIPG